MDYVWGLYEPKVKPTVCKFLYVKSVLPKQTVPLWSTLLSKRRSIIWMKVAKHDVIYLLYS